MDPGPEYGKDHGLKAAGDTAPQLYGKASLRVKVLYFCKWLEYNVAIR